MSQDQDQPRDMLAAQSFDRLIALHEDGNLNHDLSEWMREAVANVSNHYDEYRGKPSAKVSVEISITCEEGVLVVVAKPKVSMPQPPRPKRIYYATEGNALTPNNPKQLRMDLRQVDAGPKEVRNV